MKIEEYVVVAIDGAEFLFHPILLNQWTDKVRKETGRFSPVDDVEERLSRLAEIRGELTYKGEPVTLEMVKERALPVNFYTLLLSRYQDAAYARQKTEAEAGNVPSTSASSD